MGPAANHSVKRIGQPCHSRAVIMMLDPPGTKDCLAMMKQFCDVIEHETHRPGPDRLKHYFNKNTLFSSLTSGKCYFHSTILYLCALAPFLVSLFKSSFLSMKDFALESVMRTLR